METGNSETKLHFPQGFLIGAASAAHQVEGNNTHSDWWYWEQQGRLPKSGEACDHYNRYEEDFKIAHDLGLNAMRISLEWARIEPTEGHWNSQAIEHYKKVLKNMQDQGLKRIVTLWHYTLPKWAADKGGFENHEVVEAFARYAWFVAQNLGTDVDLWITLNEPEVYTMASYKRGLYPPFVKNSYMTWRVTKNLIEAHKAAYKAIKTALGDVPVGISKNSPYFSPYRNNILDRMVAFVANRLNYYLLEKIQKHLDYIGLNHYHHFKLKFNWRHWYDDMNQNPFAPTQTIPKDDKVRSDMGWVVYPEGIYHMLKIANKFKKPIYITESGIADGVDNRRPMFIRETLKWIKKAIDEGVDIKGYLYWALTDNYEWHYGFGPRFGLVEIDYVTQARKIRPSASIFKEIIT